MKPWIKQRLDQVIQNIESNAHIPHVQAMGCCQPEIENVMASTYDWSRLGVAKAVENPGEADLLIVAGWINQSLAKHLKETYANLTGRRSVIAVGSCALSGGPYLAGTSEKPIVVSDILPVDVFVPGCPPRPEALIDAIRSLKARMKPGPNKTAVLYAALRDHSRT